MEIRAAGLNDAEVLAKMMARLYVAERNEMREEAFGLLASEKQGFFIAVKKDKPIGFAHVSLRHDYVEGTEGGVVGYLEGVYVKKKHRKKGVGRNLVDACEKWATQMGCKEFASDCEQENKKSTAFHKAIGLKEVNRLVCFVKKLQ